MADNVTTQDDTLASLPDGTAIATDDVGGVHYQRIKLDVGGDGAASPLVRGQQTGANSLPVVLPSDQAALPVTDNAGSLTVDAPVTTPVFVRLSDGSSAIATLPVSLASVPSHQVTNAGTFAVQDATAQASLASIDGKITAVNTGAVVVASSALPSGAATAAKQPALGTAGTPSADVITVQGRAGMTALLTDGSATTQPISAASLPLPTGASTLAEQQSQTTSLQLLDDVVKTDDAAFTPGTDKVAMIGAQFDDTTPDSVNEGDAGAIRMSGRREMYTQIRDAAGNERGANVTAGGALLTDASATTQPISAASLPLPSGASTLAEQQSQTTHLATIAGDTTDIETAVEIMDDWDESDRAKVNIVVGQAGVTAGAGSVAANTPRVTLAADDPGVALLTTIDADTGNIATSVGVMDDWDNAASDGASVSGDVAHDTVDAGEPVKIGAKAIAHGTNPTAVAADDRTNLFANRHGVQFVTGPHMNPFTEEVTIADADGAQTNLAVKTVGAGTKIAITQVQVACDEANSVGVAFRLGFATATLPAAATTGVAGIVASHPGMVPGMVMTRGDGMAILGIGADNEDLRLTCEDPVSGSIRLVYSGFTIES